MIDKTMLIFKTHCGVSNKYFVKAILIQGCCFKRNFFVLEIWSLKWLWDENWVSRLLKRGFVIKGLVFIYLVMNNVIDASFGICLSGGLFESVNAIPVYCKYFVSICNCILYADLSQYSRRKRVLTTYKFWFIWQASQYFIPFFSIMQ